MRLRFYFRLLHKGFTSTPLRVTLRKLFEGTAAPAMTAMEFLGFFKPPTTTVPAPAFDKVTLTTGNSSAAAQFDSLQVEQVDFSKDQIRGFTMDRIDSLNASQLLPLCAMTATGGDRHRQRGRRMRRGSPSRPRGQGSVPGEVRRQARGTNNHVQAGFHATLRLEHT
jgi:hypothetical protein